MASQLIWIASVLVCLDKLCFHTLNSERQRHGLHDAFSNVSFNWADKLQQFVTEV